MILRSNIVLQDLENVSDKLYDLILLCLQTVADAYKQLVATAYKQLVATAYKQSLPIVLNCLQTVADAYKQSLMLTNNR
jgi:hypothetical protein